MLRDAIQTDSSHGSLPEHSPGLWTRPTLCNPIMLLQASPIACITPHCNSLLFALSHSPVGVRVV